MIYYIFALFAVHIEEKLWSSRSNLFITRKVIRLRTINMLYLLQLNEFIEVHLFKWTYYFCQLQFQFLARNFLQCSFSQNVSSEHEDLSQSCPRRIVRSRNDETTCYYFSHILDTYTITVIDSMYNKPNYLILV